LNITFQFNNQSAPLRIKIGIYRAKVDLFVPKNSFLFSILILFWRLICQILITYPFGGDCLDVEWRLSWMDCVFSFLQVLSDF
jgi:hypothetical protein